jgi:hypothetical protein
LKNVYVGRNADAGIGEFETHRAYIPARCDPQNSAIGHGVGGVPEKMEEGLFQQFFISLDWRQVGGDILANANTTGGKRGRLTSQSFVNERIQV